MFPPKKHSNDARKCFFDAMGGGGPAISLSSNRLIEALGAGVGD